MMDLAQQERQRAATLPAGSVVAVVLEQHARIRELCAEVDTAHGADKQAAFDELCTLLAVHEAGEEIVVRPIAQEVAGAAEAAARGDEERQAARVLADLEDLDVDGAQFADVFARFERELSEHAQHEEIEELPYLLMQCDPETQQRTGKRLLSAQRAAPEHQHSKEVPFAALLDAARERLSRDGS